MTPKRYLPQIDCACASARRTARLITQLYSQEMGAGIEPGQFSLLLAIEQMPGRSQAALGQALGLDKTTISRNLRVLTRNGWIEPAEPASGHRLTKAGSRVMAQTKPGWQRAQEKLRLALKAGEWEGMLNVFGNAARAALQAAHGDRG